jgi:flagellar biosynthetic protein FliQ
MNPTDIVKLGREALVMVILLGGPALLTSLLVGSAVALFQAVTQIHEQTLAFLPKLVLVGTVLALSAGWMMEMAVGYTTRTFNYIPTLSE